MNSSFIGFCHISNCQWQGTNLYYALQEDSVMRFPMTEKYKELPESQSAEKKQFRTQWHDPIPQILLATQEVSQDILYMIANYYTRVINKESNFDRRCNP
jgi:hypothetical protein